MNFPAFEVFGTQHIVTLLLCAAVIYLYPKFFQNKDEAKQILGGKILAGIMILHMITQPIYDVLLFELPWKEEFPLHMCDFSMLAMIVYLLRQNAPKILFYCAYFWGICGATMAMVTPDLEYGFPHGEYSPFFWGHSLILLAVFYVLMVRKERPILKDILKVVGVTLVLLIFVYIANLLIGPPANYWYLVARPVDGTLMDYFPDPPLHLIGTIPLAILLFYIAYLPLQIKDRLKK
ncbi:TIGR02206 family membrane protein [Gammaproteobacteria bacterium]|nr:TIGR02206 family membrane protein [Gammaproteobacteria bacterium]